VPEAPTGTHIYVRRINGQLAGPYCFDGNDELTGRFYNFRRIGDEIFVRLQWFSANVSGYARFKVQGNDRLVGGWWYTPEATARFAQDLKPEDFLMKTLILNRIKDDAIPSWAQEYFVIAGRQQQTKRAIVDTDTGYPPDV